MYALSAQAMLDVSYNLMDNLDRVQELSDLQVRVSVCVVFVAVLCAASAHETRTSSEATYNTTTTAMSSTRGKSDGASRGTGERVDVQYQPFPLLAVAPLTWLALKADARHTRHPSPNPPVSVTILLVLEPPYWRIRY